MPSKEATEKTDALAKASEEAKVARRYADMLMTLAPAHPTFAGALEGALKEAIAAEARLAELISNDE